MKKRRKNILIVNSINNIPSNQQYYLLGLELLKDGYHVIHVKDNSRKIENYPGTIISWKNKELIRSFFFFLNILINYKTFECVILNFRARKFSFLFYPFSKNTIITNRSDFFQKSFFNRLKTSLNFLFSSEIVTLSEFMKSKMIDIYYVNSRKIKVIYNSIDLKGIKNRNQQYLKASLPSKINVVFVGNLAYHKGFDLLMEYYSKNNSPDLFLTIIGEGEMRDLISKQIPNLLYLGRLSHSATMEIIKKNHFLILPSRNEAFGQVIIEAYALDTIPVVIGGTGNEEIILHRKTGFIGTDIEDCFELIRNLDSINYEQMMDEIRSFREKFDVNHWINNMKKLISPEVASNLKNKF